MSNGVRTEREVANLLEDDLGWRAFRAPSSGSATDRDRPDVIAGRDGRTLVFEVKKSSGDPVYVEHREVDALNAFAHDFGADAYIAVRWRSRSLRDTTIYCARTDALPHETEQYYRVKYEDCLDGGLTPLREVAARRPDPAPDA